MLHDKGYCHFANAGFDDDRQTARRHAIEKVSTLQVARRCSYLPAGQGWRITWHGETRGTTLLQLYRSGAACAKVPRLNTDQLVRRLSSDKLYESLVLPDDISSAEDAVWANLGESTSWIVELPRQGESAASGGKASCPDQAPQNLSRAVPHSYWRISCNRSLLAIPASRSWRRRQRSSSVLTLCCHGIAR